MHLEFAGSNPLESELGGLYCNICPAKESSTVGLSHFTERTRGWYFKVLIRVYTFEKMLSTVLLRYEAGMG